eukprot:scaffold95624_cov59-Attheya_sp.AAC.3
MLRSRSSFACEAVQCTVSSSTGGRASIRWLISIAAISSCLEEIPKKITPSPSAVLWDRMLDRLICMKYFGGENLCHPAVGWVLLTLDSRSESNNTKVSWGHIGHNPLFRDAFHHIFLGIPLVVSSSESEEEHNEEDETAPALDDDADAPCISIRVVCPSMFVGSGRWISRSKSNKA